MLKHRLIYGALMIVVFAGLLLFDGWLDGSIRESMQNKAIQGSLLAAITALLMVIGQLELARLMRSAGVKAFTLVTVPISVLLALSWYIPQFYPEGVNFGHLVAYLTVTAILGCFWLQARYYGTSGVVVNCGGNLMAMVYLGLLGSFILGIRIQFGLWPLIMFVFTVKSSDIGAFTAGKLFGKHKFSPQISPGKTWEGMAGGVVLSVIVACVFAGVGQIMSLPMAVVFGVLMAFIGQLGDLAESMIKRDAGMKDSSSTVPGFGGILDVVDSPLVAAPFAMLFLWLATGRG